MEIGAHRTALNLVGLLLLGCAVAWLLLLLHSSVQDTGLRGGTWLPTAATTPSR